MGILSKNDLKSIRDNAVRAKSFNWLNEAVSARSRVKRYGEVTVFLSHKHDEKTELENAIAFLNNLGVSVYVDWLDDGMPKTTSGVTAAKIKNRIKEKDKFIFLATEGAISSKWCNWELGFGDAQKYLNHIAVLPVKENYTDYTGSEYLQIYPYIYRSDSYSDNYYVRYPNGDIKSLIDWLKS
jgi:hypothetical protein